MGCSAWLDADTQVVGDGALPPGDAEVAGAPDELPGGVGGFVDEGAAAAAVEVDGSVSAGGEEEVGEFGEGGAFTVAGLFAFDHQEEECLFVLIEAEGGAGVEGLVGVGLGNICAFAEEERAAADGVDDLAGEWSAEGGASCGVDVEDGV